MTSSAEPHADAHNTDRPASSESAGFALTRLSQVMDGRAVLDGIDLDLPRGGITGILGPNGSGKSTLLKILAGQGRPTSGTVQWAGKAVGAYGARDYARRVGFLPQHLPTVGGIKARDLVGFGRYPWHGALGKTTTRDREAVDKAIDLTGTNRFADRAVDTLSGGERQRVWFAMLVAQETECLLLDEPISALDIAVQIELLKTLTHLAGETGRTVIVVLHDINMAARFCDRIVTLKAGRLAGAGSVRSTIESGLLQSIYDCEIEVLDHPKATWPVVVVH